MTGPRALPHSHEAERAVLAAVLLRPELLDELDLDTATFYSDRHRRIFACYRELASRRSPIDLRTVQAVLEVFGGKIQSVQHSGTDPS